MTNLIDQYSDLYNVYFTYCIVEIRRDYNSMSKFSGGCKHCFSVTTYNRLKCCTGLYTFNAVSADKKRQWIERLRKTSEDFRTSNPATPINRRPRLDSMQMALNGDSISLNSGNSSFNENLNQCPDTPTGRSVKPAHTQSFKSNSILHKIPKRCRSASWIRMFLT